MEKNNRLDNLFLLQNLSKTEETTNISLNQTLNRTIMDMKRNRSFINADIQKISDNKINDNNFNIFINRKNRRCASVEQILSYTQNCLENINDIEKDNYKEIISKVRSTKEQLEKTYREYMDVANNFQINYLCNKTNIIMNSLDELKDANKIVNDTDKKIKENEINMKKMQDDVNVISNNFQNLGFTIIGIIVSFTIVSTAITGIQKICITYLPLFLSFVVWTGMTLIAFASSTFKKDKFNWLSKGVYIFFTIVTFLIFIGTMHFAKPISQSKCDNCNNVTLAE